MNHYSDLGWRPLLLVALAGALVILVGIVFTVAQLVVSIQTRETRRDLTGDPWNGRTLEWSTASPPPAWNYATLPLVKGADAFWAAKQSGGVEPPPGYEDIAVPKNSALGFFLAFFATMAGFALVWHIWWLAICGSIGLLAALCVFSWRGDGETIVPAEEVARFYRGAGEASRI